jgi:flagella basal body P-ring formation protein FlgA
MSLYVRCLKSGALRGLLLLALWGLGTHAGWAQEPSQGLTNGARSWMAEKRGVRPESVEVAQPDGRLKVPVCKDGKGWQYDLAHQGTVRATCTAPVAQFYLRVSLSNAKVTSASVVGSDVQNVKNNRPVVVLRQGLLRATRLTAEQLEVLQWPASKVPLQSIDNIDNAIDAELTRDVLAGAPLRSSDLRPAMLVKRGQTVTLAIRQGGGFSITAQVEALQDGRKGDTIRLKNRESGRILSGKVVGLNSVEGQ